MKNYADTIRIGCSMGASMAMIISYSHLHSTLWAIIHGLFGWFYVLWFLIVKPYGV